MKVSVASLLLFLVSVAGATQRPVTAQCTHPEGDRFCTSGAYKVLPRYFGTNRRTRENKRRLVVHGAGGDRNEIGLFTEWTSEYIATGNHEALIIAHADSYLDAPWCDLETMRQPFYKKPKGRYSLSFAHTPNLFFVPWLLTGDDKYVAPMECLYQIYQEWVRRPNPQGKPMKFLTGRDLAWQLRNLGELAYVQSKGGTKKKIYIDILRRTRLQLTENMKLPIEREFHVLGEAKLSNVEHWSGWYEGFVGQTVNHIVQLGFKDWLPVAEWHFQHLLWRCGGKWPIKACDNDHVTPRATWAQTPPHNKKRMPLYESLPDDELVPVKYRKQFLTYHDRAQIARGWAAMAASNCIAGAKELAQKLQSLIRRRGGPRWYKYNFEVMPCTK